jgi:hypothetical protein
MPSSLTAVYTPEVRGSLRPALKYKKEVTNRLQSGKEGWFRYGRPVIRGVARS